MLEEMLDEIYYALSPEGREQFKAALKDLIQSAPEKSSQSSQHLSGKP